MTDTSEERWTIATSASDRHEFGWTTSAVMEQKKISANVHIPAGEYTTVNITRTSLSPALITHTVTSSIY